MDFFFGIIIFLFNILYTSIFFIIFMLKALADYQWFTVYEFYYLLIEVPKKIWEVLFEIGVPCISCYLYDSLKDCPWRNVLESIYLGDGATTLNFLMIKHLLINILLLWKIIIGIKVVIYLKLCVYWIVLKMIGKLIFALFCMLLCFFQLITFFIIYLVFATFLGIILERCYKRVKKYIQDLIKKIL
jgi:hypothetical protein